MTARISLNLGRTGGHRPPLQSEHFLPLGKAVIKWGGIKMMRLMWKTTLGGFLFLSLTCTTVWGQSTAQVSGTVKDQSGAVLPGVEVTATQTATGLARSVVTNETGRSEEHTSELQSRENLVCRLLLEKKKKIAAASLCFSKKYGRCNLSSRNRFHRQIKEFSTTEVTGTPGSTMPCDVT